MSMTWSPEVAMSQEELGSFLDQKLIARLSSNRADGYPHTTPLWYYWDGQYLWFILGAGQRPRQHIRNLRRDPRLSVIIDVDQRPEHGRLLDAQGVTVRGTAELFSDEQVQLEVSEKLLRRYFGEEGLKSMDNLLEDGKPGRNRVIIKVTPQRIFSWDFRKLEG